MTSFEILLVTSLLILFVFWKIFKFTKNHEFYKDIPGPPPLPLVGNALDFKSSVEGLPTLHKYTKKYGDIVKLQIGPFWQVLLVTDPKFLETILTSSKMLKKSENYKIIHSWLGTGLLSSEGTKWKKHRHLLTSAFHFQILEQFVEVFESCSSKLVQKLQTEIGNEGIDVYPFVTLCTLDIICESTMGISVHAQDNNYSEYVHSVEEMKRIYADRNISLIQMLDFSYRFTKNYQTELQALKVLHGQTDAVILQRKQELTKTQNTISSKTRKPFLDLLLEGTIDGKPLTNKEIREEVDTFMFAGHDTTASAISFTLFCLANHQDVQEKVMEEQRHIFSNQNPTVTLDDLQKMNYLEQVIKESLRLYPPAPVIGRTTSKEVVFENKKLPEGDNIYIFVFGLHRNAKYYENPEEFNPNRFDKTDGKLLPFTYIPFSAGPRNCIGQKFAMLEMKSIISKILRQFELRPASPKHELILVAEGILKSKNGVKISLSLRK